MSFPRLRLSAGQLLSFLNLFLLALVAMCLILVFLLSSKTIEEFPSPAPKTVKGHLPKNPFAQPSEAYEKIGEGPFALKFLPPQLQLPDLRKELLYLGKNERPDVPKGSQLFHVCLKNADERLTFRQGERIYLTYQGGISNDCFNKFGSRESVSGFSKGAYSFSPGNQPTSLWIEMHSLNSESIEISVGMLDEKGSLIESPSENRSFLLTRSEGFSKAPGQWEIGGLRVDTTLLIRQKARWIGPDVFLEQCGGEEFAYVQGRQRIDFIENELPYTCFVKLNDCLIWKEGRWVLPTSTENTLGFPLLIVKKVDEKVMSFEIWDPDGKTKMALTLLKVRDYEPMPAIDQDFKFVGAKTWAQFIVECKSQRLILRPHDWIVLTKEGWQKLNSPEEVDDFVNQKIVGPLFILEKMVKKNGQQVLVGHLFNSARTEMQEVELPAVQSPLLSSYSSALSTPLKAEAVPEHGGNER